MKDLILFNKTSHNKNENVKLTFPSKPVFIKLKGTKADTCKEQMTESVNLLF